MLINSDFIITRCLHIETSLLCPMNMLQYVTIKNKKNNKEDSGVKADEQVEPPRQGFQARLGTPRTAGPQWRLRGGRQGLSFGFRAGVDPFQHLAFTTL